MNGNERRQRTGNWLNPGALKCLKPIRPSSAKKRLNHRYTSKRLVRICVREREKERESVCVCVIERVCVCIHVCVCVCVSVCVCVYAFVS